MATRRTCGVVCGVVLVLTCMTPAAWAQFASSLEGTVTDSTGGLVPGASVTILNESTGATQTVTTTGAGYYRFPALPGVNLHRPRHARRIQDRRAGAHRPAVRRDPDRQRRRSSPVRCVEEVTVSGQTPLVETAQGRVSGLDREPSDRKPAAHGAQLLQPRGADARCRRSRHRGRTGVRAIQLRPLQQRVRREHERQRRARRVEQLPGRLLDGQLEPAQRRRQHQSRTARACRKSGSR